MKTIISILTIIFLFISVPLWAVDLTKATLQELVSQRPDLVQDIKAGKDEGIVTISVIKDAKGRMGIWTEETKDLDDNLISKRKDKYVYYATGEIDTITMEKYNDKNILISKKKLKHYRNGTQPDTEITDIDI